MPPRRRPSNRSRARGTSTRPSPPAAARRPSRGGRTPSTPTRRLWARAGSGEGGRPSGKRKPVGITRWARPRAVCARGRSRHRALAARGSLLDRPLAIKPGGLPGPRAAAVDDVASGRLAQEPNGRADRPAVSVHRGLRRIVRVEPMSALRASAREDSALAVRVQLGSFRRCRGAVRSQSSRVTCARRRVSGST